MTPFPKPFPFLKPVVLISIFICLIYSNTLDSPWQFDDYHNITENPKIQMQTLNWASIKASFYATPFFENTLYRPVSNLSFALNWLWGKNNVTGYHIVNITIHIITALLLYLTIINLFQTPNAGQWESDSLNFIALLSTVLWAVHPIQIQSVTYIVQRMASLAALFYLAGILFYLKTRMTLSGFYRIIFGSLCALAFLLGLGSKNNAILLPVSLLLIELIFFRDLSKSSTKKKAVVLISVSALLIAVAGVLFFFEKGFDQIFDAYKTRPFTMGQRLLTQPSILIFYLSQIFYPVANRFSITHDVVYATSLFNPWYTFFAIVLVILFISFALLRIRKNPMLSLAILFYFGNQAIESTFIALEMVFEHRNYLPSFFLFIPVAMGINKMLSHYKTRQKPMYYLLVCFVCALVTGIGLSTYIRNWDWRSTQSLWQEAALKAPKSSRPLHNLAWGYYTPTGQYEKAIEIYIEALQLRDEKGNYKGLIYNNLADIYNFNLKDYEKAVEYAQKAIEIIPDYFNARMILSDSLAKLGQYDRALEHLRYLIEKQPPDHRTQSLLGNILMKTFRYDSALTHFQQCVKLDPNNWEYLRDIGICLTQMQYYDRGYWFLKRAQDLKPKMANIFLACADNRIKKGVPEESAVYIRSLIQVAGFEQIEKILEGISKDPLAPPLNIPDLAGRISEHIQDLSDSEEKTAANIKRIFKINGEGTSF